MFNLVAEDVNQGKAEVSVLATKGAIFILPDKNLGFKEYTINPALGIVEIPFAVYGEFTYSDPFCGEPGIEKGITIGLANFYCVTRETTLSFEQRFRRHKNESD